VLPAGDGDARDVTLTAQGEPARRLVRGSVVGKRVAEDGSQPKMRGRRR